MAAEDSTAAAQLLEQLDHALLAQNTHCGYRADWRMFCRWCEAERVSALPATPDTLALYIACRLNQARKVSTITRHVAAVGYMHRREHLETPATPRIRELLRAARRMRGDPVKRVRPLSVDDIRAVSLGLAAVDTATASRNRAIVLVGFASALRSASLVELTLGDALVDERGLTLHVRREKTDQEGRGRWIGIPRGEHRETDAVGALEDWLRRRGGFDGPLFTRCGGGNTRRPLQPERICQIVQQSLGVIGRDPRGYGSHSIRSGFVTEAVEAGCSELLIASQTGHRSLDTLRAYFRRTDLFRANPCASLGL